jgi:hypothetical protein
MLPVEYDESNLSGQISLVECAGRAHALMHSDAAALAKAEWRLHAIAGYQVSLSIYICVYI